MPWMTWFCCRVEWLNLGWSDIFGLCALHLFVRQTTKFILVAKGHHECEKRFVYLFLFVWQYIYYCVHISLFCYITCNSLVRVVRDSNSKANRMEYVAYIRSGNKQTATVGALLWLPYCNHLWRMFIHGQRTGVFV